MGSGEDPRPPWPVVWGAKWIWWCAPPLNFDNLVSSSKAPPETWNRFGYLRRCLQLDLVPDRAVARVSADSRFVLFVNGHEVARGPSRSVPERLAWTEVDLASHLVVGPNVVAALVRFYGRPMAWWRPARPNVLLGYGSFILEAPAIGLVTDAGWRGRPAPYQQDPGGHPFYPATEVIDGAQEPVGWNTADFDDAGWAPATELMSVFLGPDPLRVPAEPFSAPEHDGIAPLTALPVALNELVRIRVTSPPAVGDEAEGPVASLRSTVPSDDGTDELVTFDAGRITLATPWMEVDGPAGSVVDLFVGEDRRDDGMVETKPRDYALRYRLSGHGPERVEAFETVGFRWLQAVGRGGARLRGVGAVERRYPRATGPDCAAFRCDDEQLNQIWEVGARTLDVCSTDAFVDCPGREQRAWIGDAYVHGLVTFVTNRDWRLARRNLRLCAQGRRADGLLTMCATGDLSTMATTIPDYSLHWVRSVARYVERTADRALWRELGPTVVEVLAAFERFRSSDGMLRGVTGWIFVDWAQTQRAEVVGAVDALYAAALDEVAVLMEWARIDPELIGDLRDRRDRTRQAFDLLWDPERGAYVDAADGRGRLGRISQQTNAAAIIGGCAPPERWASMLDRVMDPERVVITQTPADIDPPLIELLGQWFDPADHMKFDEVEDVVGAQPFFSHFVHQAVVAAGRTSSIPELCRRWWPQIQRGNTTFEEYWEARPGRGSRAHAWSTTPVYDLVTHVLGVRPLQPGCAEVAFEPCFGGLTTLSGRVPVPGGMVEIDADPERAQVTVPSGTVVVTGDGTRLGPGRHQVSLSDAADRGAPA